MQVVATAEAAEGRADVLSNGEYRTVLAAQRTLLAFLRTALAVLVVFRASALGPVLASLIALAGIAQFVTTMPLFLQASMRIPKLGPGDIGSRADPAKLFTRTQWASAGLAALVVACAAVAIPWRYDDAASSVIVL